MRTGWVLGLRTALLLTLLAGAQPLLAQTGGRTWVDPPGEPGAPAQASPPPAESQNPAPRPIEPSPAPQTAAPPIPTQSAQPAKPASVPEAPPAQPVSPSVAAQPPDSDRDRRTGRASAAKAFAIRYLNSWSAPNDEALEATAEFYAPEILFHGRTVSMKRLFDEKRRFVKRWPEREYRPREDAMGVVCNSTADICTVHAVFDFTAANPARRRLSQGAGALQLIVQFIGEKPVIVAEHSTLLGQTRKRNLALEGHAND